MTKKMNYVKSLFSLLSVVFMLVCDFSINNLLNIVCYYPKQYIFIPNHRAKEAEGEKLSIFLQLLSSSPGSSLLSSNAPTFIMPLSSPAGLPPFKRELRGNSYSDSGRRRSAKGPGKH